MDEIIYMCMYTLEKLLFCSLNESEVFTDQYVCD